MNRDSVVPVQSFVRALTLSAAIVAVCVWLVFVGSYKQPAGRRISNVALSQTGRWLAAGTSQGVITVWDREQRSLPYRIRSSWGSLNDLQFSPDERLLAIANRNLALYPVGRPAEPRLLRSDDRNYGTVRFSADGQTALVITGSGYIETLDARSGGTRFSACCSTIYGEVAFSPDEATIASAGHWPGLWEAQSGRLSARLTRNREFHTLRPIAFDPRRRSVLMGSQDGRVYAWDLTTRQLLTMSPAQAEYVDTIVVMSAGWVAYAGFGSIVQLWNPDTGEHRPLPGAWPTSNLAPGIDHTSIIFGTAAGAVELWDAQQSQLVQTLTSP